VYTLTFDNEARVSVATVTASYAVTNIALDRGIRWFAHDEPSMIHKLIDLQFAGFATDPEGQHEAMETEREFSAASWDAWMRDTED
jgi:hypothetical protein